MAIVFCLAVIKSHYNVLEHISRTGLTLHGGTNLHTTFATLKLNVFFIILIRVSLISYQNLDSNVKTAKNGF